jgi:long-subunit fatty acid transport protein
MGNPNRSSISFLNHTFLNVPDFCGLRGAAPPKKNCATEKTVLPKMYFSTYYNDGFTLLLSALFKNNSLSSIING